MSDIIMQIQDIVKEFPLADGSTLRACNGISIDVERGETLAIVGESGCGKSTLVKTIMNMHEPTSGSVMFRGKDITKLKGEEKTPKIIVIFKWYSKIQQPLSIRR